MERRRERERLRGGIIERERWRDRDNAIEGKEQREREMERLKEEEKLVQNIKGI